MQLLIYNSQGINLDGYCNWLLPYIQQDIIDSVTDEKMKARDEKINKLIDFKVKQMIPAITLLKIAVNNLEWKKGPGTQYKLQINPNTRVYGTRTRVAEVAKAFEYGVTGMQPLFIFRDVFDKYANQLDKNYDKYIIITGGTA